MNGWKNRETWLVNIWFGDCWTMMQEDGVAITPEFIQAEVEAYVDEIVPASSFIADMMDMGAIDYDELASHYAPEEDVDA
jgi:hypothetical protein